MVTSEKSRSGPRLWLLLAASVALLAVAMAGLFVIDWLILRHIPWVT